jgi:hypothetical protein
MRIVDWKPAEGSAFQGDVSITPVPAGWGVKRTEEIAPINGRLILQEGEVSGHHHAITLPERPRDFAPPTRNAAGKVNRKWLEPDTYAKVALPTARLYRDADLAQRMASSEGPLTRSDLIVGFLLVEHGPMVVSHEEHDGIRLPPGLFCIGRQVESAGAEERNVSD